MTQTYTVPMASLICMGIAMLVGFLLPAAAYFIVHKSGAARNCPSSSAVR